MTITLRTGLLLVSIAFGCAACTAQPSDEAIRQAVLTELQSLKNDSNFQITSAELKSKPECAPKGAQFTCTGLETWHGVSHFFRYIGKGDQKVLVKDTDISRENAKYKIDLFKTDKGWVGKLDFFGSEV
jgi:hypothetical protein